MSDKKVEANAFKKGDQVLTALSGDKGTIGTVMSVGNNLVYVQWPPTRGMLPYDHSELVSVPAEKESA